MKYTWIAFLLLAGCMTSHTLLGTARPPIAPDAVKVYLTNPPNAELVALVSADNGWGMTGQQAQEGALSLIKKRCAQLGANGLVITSHNLDMWNGATINGQAVYVPPSTNQVLGAEAAGLQSKK